jgi:nucleotide-binding universal stress UspA family protein
MSSTVEPTPPPAPDARRPTIVVGYDGSDASRAAVDIAARRGGRDGLVVVVHAFELPAEFSVSHEDEGRLAAGRAHGQALIDSLLLDGNAGLLDIECETELLEGPPAVVIAELAVAWDADEIIIGAGGLGRGHAALGRVSHQVLQLADRPVTVVPTPSVDHLHGLTPATNATSSAERSLT